MAKDILVAYGVDVDAVAGWLGSYGGEDSPCDISRGMFAGEVGSMRLLRLFDRWGIRTTWFVPGHSIETFPDQMKAVADAGHEIGMHGYSHENPIAMTPEQEEAIFDRCVGLITELSGKPPRGYVAPWWEFGPRTNELLLKKGIRYDHSLMHNDFHPYYARVGDSWTKIDYSQQPETWMKPLERGAETDLVEILAQLNDSIASVVREVSRMSGIKATIEGIRLLEEPQAAFYAWIDSHPSSERKKLLSAGDRVVVFDVGGGTTDFTLISVGEDGDSFDRKAVGDHLLLGGDNIDLTLAKLIESRLGAGRSKSVV